ncbi:MAG: hypothetical protein J6Z00_00560 [Clostridia bacterium]|nr:hypothetical protein [Clostridia bacterium]
MKKQILCFVLVLLVGIFSVPAYTVSAFLVADVIYTQENNWEGTLELTSNQTVKLKDIIHENSGITDRGSAIKISENATVNLIFEGTCVLAGNPDYISAGIEVSEGSRVNIDGLNGSSLTVTGGKWSAGIGGVGYGSASTGNSKAGNIHIYSGTIKAIGGQRGAGIGSGYHSSASDIFIEGGNVTAIGTECGAGIGSGYGTSGGAAYDAAGNVTASGVGYYNGGTITIRGDAVVKAAAYPINFDNFDPYNTDTLYGEGFENTHAAGIGGGYGASSGTIAISEQANVTAIGSSGGAGIGSGRGTSKPKNFDDKNYDITITINNSAKVFAFATNDTRSGQRGDGGAAIGHGYGNGLEEQIAVGKVRIRAASSVYAVGAQHAQAIGGSRVVGSFEEGSVPPLAEIKALELSETATIVAISDGYYKPITRNKFYKEKEFISLNFSDEVFKENASFFTEEKFPLKIKAFDHENERVNTTFSIQKPNKTNVIIFLSRASNYYFELKDYQTEDGDCVYLANNINVPSSSFLASNGEMAEYSSIELTSPFRSSGILETTDGPVKVSLRANEGVFSLGSIFSASVIQDADRIAEIRSRIDSECLEDLDKLYFFDLSVSDPKGQPYENLLGSVTLLIQVLDGWDPNNMLLLYPTEGQDECRRVSVSLIQGKKYAKIELTHFSDYVLAVYKEKIPEGVVTENSEISTQQGTFTTSPTNSEAKKSPQTAETGAVCLGLLGLGVLALLKKKIVNI